MSSPVVETKRAIPLIIEQGFRIPMDDEDSGFPFDRDADRDGHFRTQLDDIAKRHPEFAEHLGNFSLRSSPRRQSGGGTEDPDLHSRFERPFGGRFERFGFPFDRDDDDFDPEQYAQQFYQPQPQPEYHQPEQQQQNYQQQPRQPHSPEYRESQPQCSQPQTTGNPPPAPERDRNNIQQSNTIDLGQKQEPVNERNQRSMSAPPTEKGQRFTSSIKIPVNQPSESENMATHPQQQSDAKTTERIIPIHIEGRDEPVFPKNAPSSYSQPHQTSNTSPQPEKIFGQDPNQFTQFVNREQPRQQYDKWHPKSMHHAFSSDEPSRPQMFQQRGMSPQFQQQRSTPTPTPHVHPQQEEIPIPVQREVPQTKQQAPQQQAAPPQQPPQPPQQPPQPPKPAPQQRKPLTPIDQIQAIEKDVSALMEQVDQFAGQPKDKQYLYLDEMLTRNLLKLDNVDTQGQENIRSCRKEAIKSIEKAIALLETRAASNVVPPPAVENMEIEAKPQESPVENCEPGKKDDNIQPMETEQVQTNSAEKIEESQQQPMEIVPDNSNSETIATVEQKTESTTATEGAEVEKTLPLENKVEPQAESCEGQESNLPVAEAVKKFEGGMEKKEESIDDKKDNSELKDASQGEGTNQEETKVEGKKGKQKGKKKAEKKEK